MLAALEMRRLDPSRREHAQGAFVFGDAVGQRVKSVRKAWENCRAAAGLPELHLADLRHEAGSRFEEAGVPTAYVSKFLGHGNLTTTTRYLNPTRRGLRLAIEKLEEFRTRPEPVAGSLQAEAQSDADSRPEACATPTHKPLIC